MLRSVKSLEGNTLGALTVRSANSRIFTSMTKRGDRYAVVDTSTWLGGRKVLVSPYAIPRAVDRRGNAAGPVTGNRSAQSEHRHGQAICGSMRKHTWVLRLSYYWGGSDCGVTIIYPAPSRMAD